jgi:hypothetical protein
MAKPSRKKAATQPEQQAEPTVEELKAEVAKFDHDGDGHMGGSKPHDAPVETAETDARSQTVSLGTVECRLRRVPVETVLGLLGPDGLRRIEAHQTNASFESTCERLLATDGRATPAIFAAPELAGGQPTILHGFEEIAAAKVCGIPDLPVILVPTGGASAAQSYIVEMVRQQRQTDKPSDDDELFYRVHAEG